MTVPMEAHDCNQLPTDAAELAHVLLSKEDEVAHGVHGYIRRRMQLDLHGRFHSLRPHLSEQLDDVAQSFYLNLIESIADKIKVNASGNAVHYLNQCIRNFLPRYFNHHCKTTSKSVSFCEETTEIESSQFSSTGLLERTELVREAQEMALESLQASLRGYTLSLDGVFLLQSRFYLLKDCMGVFLEPPADLRIPLLARMRDALGTDVHETDACLLPFLKQLALPWLPAWGTLRIRPSDPTILDQWGMVEERIHAFMSAHKNGSQGVNLYIRDFVDAIGVTLNLWYPWCNRIKHELGRICARQGVDSGSGMTCGDMIYLLPGWWD